MNEMQFFKNLAGFVYLDAFFIILKDKVYFIFQKS